MHIKFSYFSSHHVISEHPKGGGGEGVLLGFVFTLCGTALRLYNGVQQGVEGRRLKGSLRVHLMSFMSELDILLIFLFHSVEKKL